MRMRAKMIILFKKIFFLFFTLDSAHRNAVPSPIGHFHSFIYVLAIPFYMLKRRNAYASKNTFFALSPKK